MPNTLHTPSAPLPGLDTFQVVDRDPNIDPTRSGGFRSTGDESTTLLRDGRITWRMGGRQRSSTVIRRIENVPEGCIGWSALTRMARRIAKSNLPADWGTSAVLDCAADVVAAVWSAAGLNPEPRCGRLIDSGTGAWNPCDGPADYRHRYRPAVLYCAKHAPADRRYRRPVIRPAWPMAMVDERHPAVLLMRKRVADWRDRETLRRSYKGTEAAMTALDTQPLVSNNAPEGATTVGRSQVWARRHADRIAESLCTGIAQSYRADTATLIYGLLRGQGVESDARELERTVAAVTMSRHRARGYLTALYPTPARLYRALLPLDIDPDAREAGKRTRRAPDARVGTVLIDAPRIVRQSDGRTEHKSIGRRVTFPGTVTVAVYPDRPGSADAAREMCSLTAARSL